MKAIHLSILLLALVSMPLLAQPGISQQPTNQVVANGGTAAFSVTVSNSGPFTYQWLFNSNNISPFITTVAGNGSRGYSGDGGTATNAMLYLPYSVAVDNCGNLFVADELNERIRKVDTNGIITTVVGTGNLGYSGDGGLATNATLLSPNSVAVDGYGNLFIADTSNNRIRKVDTNGVITTVAGGGSGGDGGAATNASLNVPSGVTVDGYGNLFIADSWNYRIHKVDTNGVITSVAGNGNYGYSGDGREATNAMLSFIYGVTADNFGNLFIGDWGNNRVRKVDTNGIITTVAGNGNSGYSGDGGASTDAALLSPYGVAADKSGNLFIADSFNNRVRKVDANGIITTVAGNGTHGSSGDGNLAANAMLSTCFGVAVDSHGNLFIADTYNNRIRRVFAWPTNLSTLTLPNVSTNNLGNYSVVITDASGSVTSSVATLNMPPYITFQPTNQTALLGGSVAFPLITGGSLPLTRQWTLNGTNLPDATNSSYIIANATLTNAGTYVLTVTNLYGSIVSSNVILTVAYIGQQPTNQTAAVGGVVNFGVLMSAPGPFSYQWQFNGVNLPMNVILPAGYITTVAGKSGQGYSGDGGPATNALLSLPCGVAVDGFGSLFIADTLNNRIRKVDNNGVITTLAGNGTNGFSGDTGAATNAKLNSPYGVAVDSYGNLFIADRINGRVREVDTDGVITTVAGGGSGGLGDGGAATNAQIAGPNGVATDNYGNLFISDTRNQRVRKVNTNGIITTVAGNGIIGFSGDTGAATNAELNYPSGLAPDGYGNLFIADYSNSRVRKVDTNGIITTVAGNGTTGYSGDGGAATNAALVNPSGVAVDSCGNLFIADYNNSRIREVDTNGIITTIAGNGISGWSGDGIQATNSRLCYPSSVAVDTYSDLLVADTVNNKIRKVVGNPPYFYTPNSPNFTFGNISVTNAGSYSVVISNSSGCITSSVVTLTVEAPPFIATQPASQNVGAGSNPSFSVVVLGSGPFGFGLYFGGTNLVQSSTSSSLMLFGVSTNNSGIYTVVVTNVYGSATSSVAKLLVFRPPEAFTAQANIANNILEIALQFSGTPNYPYVLQSATNLTPPVNWQPVLTNPADASGNWQFTDRNLNTGQKYYRAVAY